MEIINAKKFYQQLKERLHKDEESIIKEYKHSKAWTSYLTDTVQKMLEQYPELRTSREYFRIDLIGWSGPFVKTEPKHPGHRNYESDDKCKLNEYNWNLEIAIEFENNQYEWMDEIIKLCHINCGLRILIAYSDYRNRDMDEEKLNLAASHMQTLKYADLDKPFLVIIGNCNKNKYNNFFDIGLRAYHWVDRCFIPLGN